MAERVLGVVGETIVLDALRVPVGVSIGSLYPAHASTPAALLSVADHALYRAKSSGRACFCLGGPDDVEGASRAFAG